MCRWWWAETLMWWIWDLQRQKGKGITREEKVKDMLLFLWFQLLTLRAPVCPCSSTLPNPLKLKWNPFVLKACFSEAVIPYKTPDQELHRLNSAEKENDFRWDYYYTTITQQNTQICFGVVFKLYLIEMIGLNRKNSAQRTDIIPETM